MKTRNWLIGIGLVCLTACADTKSGDVSGRFDADEALAYCDAQVRRTLDELAQRDGGVDYTMMPRNIADSASHWYCSKVTKDEWCAGFWPGILWYDYEYTNDPAIRQEAEKFTASLEYLTYEPAYDHDLGFLMFCSYGNGYRLTRNESYRQAILRSAEALSALFNPKVGTMLSWPRNVAMFGGHNTIMDNMINLEMLFWAAKNGGDKKLYDMAVSHADTTMKYHFRPDYTSYHLVSYNDDGTVQYRMTHQGKNDESAWARGQGWAVYGYTSCYRETKDTVFLNQAVKVADMIMKRVNTSDLIPYWDFDAPVEKDTPRDASAGAVIASAFLELSTMVPDGERYFDYAQKQLESLSGKDYLAQKGTNKGFVLMHSTGSLPHGSEIDTPLNYADYYYLEAMKRYLDIKEGNGLAASEALAEKK